jgi:hypothetical protein
MYNREAFHLKAVQEISTVSLQFQVSILLHTLAEADKTLRKFKWKRNAD